ncbi:hypothetical protein OSB04_019355 [Centaurea solstitialis]|uniref:Uncharacterized protein n=1 Tax=Centaurea solstitialis TaxID=347529 RepID=A0AA38W4Y9_9ASTR|nr:hypothetical protein OSB04_019355 [Centaurea solstitialis]
MVTLDGHFGCWCTATLKATMRTRAKVTAKVPHVSLWMGTLAVGYFKYGILAYSFISPYLPLYNSEFVDSFCYALDSSSSSSLQQEISIILWLSNFGIRKPFILFTSNLQITIVGGFLFISRVLLKILVGDVVSHCILALRYDHFTSVSVKQNSSSGFWRRCRGSVTLKVLISSYGSTSYGLDDEPLDNEPPRPEPPNIINLANSKEGRIMDYAVPVLDQLNSGIARPRINAHHFELKPIMFHMLQTNGQFAGFPSDDPHAHLKSFMVIDAVVIIYKKRHKF